MSSCDHKTGRWVPGPVDEETGEPGPECWEEDYLYEDIDTGRYRCTRCGEVFYYTEHWRAFYQEGKPCLGSDRVKRD